MIKKFLLVLGILVVLFVGVNTVMAAPMDPNADIDIPYDYTNSSGWDLIPESWAEPVLAILSVILIGVLVLAIVALPFRLRDWLRERPIRRKIENFSKQHPGQQLDRVERRKQRAMRRNRRNTGA